MFMMDHELSPADWRPVVYGRGSSQGTESRRRPRAGERARAIAAQDNCCLYCEIPIGATIRRNGKDVTLRAQWDHFVPYSYLARNPSANWVLACHVCNLIKSSRMFTTVQAARGAILPERIAKGCEPPEASLLRAMTRPARPARARRSVRSPLGPRQTEVLELVARGMSNFQVARALGVKPPKVREHLQAAVRALGATDCHEAAATAIKRGYIAAPADASSGGNEA